MRHQPASDRDFAVAKRDADRTYIEAMDVALGAAFPNADAEGVRLLDTAAWARVAATATLLPEARRRAPRPAEVEHLAAMADARRAQDAVDPFACFAGADR